MSTSPVMIQLTGVLLDSSGNPVAGETVAFSYKLSSAMAYTSAGSAVTDSTGSASVTLSLLAPEMYDFQGAFNGDTLFAASNAVIMFDTTAAAASTSIVISATTAPVNNGVNVTVTGTISASIAGANAPVSGAILSVALDGMVVGQTNPSDSSGAFSFQILSVPLGAHTIAVSYAGSTAYLPSQGTTTVGGAPGAGFPIVPLVVGAAVGLLSLGLYITRRKKR